MGWEESAGSVVLEGEALTTTAQEGLAQESKRRVALEQVLLFHGAGQWDDAKRSKWANNCSTLLRTPPQDFRPLYDPKYTFDCTTKVLCDCVRAALMTDIDNLCQRQGL